MLVAASIGPYGGALADGSEFTGDYDLGEEQLVDPDDVVIETSSGTLDIARPGRFRWSYYDPYQQFLIADGLNLWSYDVDLEQVSPESLDASSVLVKRSQTKAKMTTDIAYSYQIIGGNNQDRR